MPSNQYVNIKVYDMLGKEISTLINDKLTSEAAGSVGCIKLSKWFIFFNIEFENYFKTTKILLLK